MLRVHPLQEPAGQEKMEKEPKKEADDEDGFIHTPATDPLISMQRPPEEPVKVGCSCHSVLGPLSRLRVLASALLFFGPLYFSLYLSRFFVHLFSFVSLKLKLDGLAYYK